MALALVPPPVALGVLTLIAGGTLTDEPLAAAAAGGLALGWGLSVPYLIFVARPSWQVKLTGCLRPSNRWVLGFGIVHLLVTVGIFVESAMTLTAP